MRRGAGSAAAARCGLGAFLFATVGWVERQRDPTPYELHPECWVCPRLSPGSTQPTTKRRKPMAVKRLGIIMNGVTGRMGTNQHLVRSIVAIRNEGGVTLGNGDRVMPDPDPGRPQRGEARRAGQGATASRASRPTSTRRWPTGTTPCSSTPPPRRCGPRCWPRPSTPASTSTARSRSPPPWKRRWRSCARPRPPASAMAWCRTSCSCRACGSSSC